MAAGDTLAVLHAVFQNETPASNFASANTRNDRYVLEFPDGSDTDGIYTTILPRNYGGGGITVYLHWSADGVTTGNVVWEVSFERIGDGIQDTDSDGFATAQSLTDAAPGTDGDVTIGSIAFTDGAQIDSIAVGETYTVRVRRNGDDVSDTMTAKAQLRTIEIRETPA